MAAYNPYNLSNSSKNLFSGTGMSASMGGSAGSVESWGGVADWSQPFSGKSNDAAAINSAAGAVADATGGATGSTGDVTGGATQDYGPAWTVPGSDISIGQNATWASLDPTQAALVRNSIMSNLGINSGDLPDVAGLQQYGTTHSDYATPYGMYTAEQAGTERAANTASTMESQRAAQKEFYNSPEQVYARQQQTEFDQSHPAQAALRNFQAAHAGNEIFGMGEYQYVGLPNMEGYWLDPLMASRNTAGSGWSFGNSGASSGGYANRLATLQAAADAEIGSGRDYAAP